MVETKQCDLRSPLDLWSTDLSSALFRRVGIATTLLTAGLIEGYMSDATREPLAPPTPPVDTLIPADPLIAESNSAFSVGERIGKDVLVYFNAAGHHKTHIRLTRELFLNENSTSPQGGLAGWDVFASDKGPPLPFSMSEFEVWRTTQMTELQNRPDIKSNVMIAGSGVLFSIDGSVFLTSLIGHRTHLRQLEPVEPLLDGAGGR